MTKKRYFKKKRLLTPLLIPMSALQISKAFGKVKSVMNFITKKLISTKLMAKTFKGYTPTEHDVFISIFPKSGNNWAMQIGQQIAWKGESEYEHIHDVVAWPDTVVPGVIPLKDPTPQTESPTGLRMIKTRAAGKHLPYCEDSIYITILRDPKEVFVSTYHFLLNVFGVIDHISIQEWFEMFMTPDFLGAKWTEHAASLWEWRDRPNVLVLTFNEMKKDPRKCISLFAKTMKVTLTEEEFEKVVERSSFSYMKEHEPQFSPPLLPFVKKQTKMLRAGKSGNSGEMLTKKQQAMIDQYVQKKLKELGSDFPYEEKFTVITPST